MVATEAMLRTHFRSKEERRWKRKNRRRMEKQKTREKTKTETKEDLDDLNDMDAMFGNDETEEEAQAKLETIQKLVAASTASSTALKEVWTGRNHRRLPVEIASPATSTYGFHSVENMLSHENASWMTQGTGQEESVELKVHDESVVSGFKLASPCSVAQSGKKKKKYQIRVEEVLKHGAIGVELIGWNNFGADGRDSNSIDDGQLDYISVSTTATRFKISVRQVPNHKHADAGVGMFRAVGTPAPGTEDEVFAWAMEIEAQRAKALEAMMYEYHM